MSSPMSYDKVLGLIATKSCMACRHGAEPIDLHPCLGCWCTYGKPHFQSHDEDTPATTPDDPRDAELWAAIDAVTQAHNNTGIRLAVVAKIMAERRKEGGL
jgi:hypothetical protein